MAECIALLQPLAVSKSVTISQEMTAIEVRGDAQKLAQVVTNLLSNAIQYNRPGGQITVRLRADQDNAIFEVADTGCGIPEEDRPHLFERFYRVDKARSRASGGNGLGLAICKSIVEIHDGKIGFTTVVNEGTTFWVRLPATTSEPRSSGN